MVLALRSGAEKHKNPNKNMKWNLSVKDRCVILMKDYEQVFLFIIVCSLSCLSCHVMEFEALFTFLLFVL